MTRRCSHCGHNGHNSRTCPDRGVRLFGVRLTDAPASRSSASTSIAMRKSASMGCLSSSASGVVRESSTTPEQSESGEAGYVSDGLVQTSRNARERKKGVSWTEDEHRRFLLGLAKLGKGDWRGISRHYVPTRTPTQVASHAQKYYIRQNNQARNRRRRSSLFDIPSESTEAHGQLIANPPVASDNFSLNPTSANPFLMHPRLHQTTEQSQLYHLNPRGNLPRENPAMFLPAYVGGVGSGSGVSFQPSAVVIDPHEELTRLTLGPSLSSLPPSPSPVKLEQTPFSNSSSAPGSSRSNPIRVS